MFEKFIKEIENQQITVSQWIAGFLGIFFVRFILESLSSPSYTGIIPSDPYTFVHYMLFFVSVVLSTACVIGFITKNYKSAVKIILFGLPVIWIAPLIDIVLSHGRGYKMAYIFDTHQALFFDFLTFFGPNLTKGATYGIRIEIILILFGIGWYVWTITKNVRKTIVAVFASYVLGFVLASIPGIIYTLSHSQQGNAVEVMNYLEQIIVSSNIYHNTLHEGPASVSNIRFFELGFNKLISQILFIFSFIFAGILFWKIDSKKFLSVIKNVRLERLNFYTASLISGMGFAYIHKIGNPFVWVDLLGITCLIISWTALWMQAVHQNDVFDLEIDKISNTQRPLVKNELNKEEMSEIGTFFLCVALLGSWVSGFYPFFMSLVYLALSYIYSCPPLRLRRFPIIPSFLISIACLSTILAGFFFVSVHKEIQAFPIKMAVGIIIIVTLAVNFKDLKDVEGDSANGITTLATMFPKNAAKIIGILLAFSILLTPIFLSFYFLYIFAIPASIIGYKIINAKPYREKPIFTLRLVFLVCIALSYLGVYYLAGML